MSWNFIFWAVVLFALCGVLFAGRKPPPPPIRGEPYSPAEPAKIEPTGLEALDQFLDRRRVDEENEKRAQEDHRNRLLEAWAQVEPSVMQAIDVVNAKLAQHGKMKLVGPTTPTFVGRDNSGYGFSYFVAGDAVKGNIPISVTAEKLIIADTFSNGYEIPIQHVRTEVVANALAEGVRWAIEG
jgi:hypothetical protein